MSQKFILFTEKTSKKTGNYEQEKLKRFNRKRSQRQHSIDSKRSREDSIASLYIKDPTITNQMRFSRIHQQASEFLQKINTTMILDSDFRQRQPRKNMYNRTNTSRDKGKDETALMLRIQTLEAEIDLKKHQLQVLTEESDRYKSHLNEEKQKRRKLQFQKRNFQKEIQQLQRNFQKISLENKKLNKQKQYFLKQIQFLQKINYDQKIRSIQSFRQKYMEQQLFKLREEIKIKKNSKEKQLELQIQNLRHQNDTTQGKFRAIKSLVIVLQCKIQKMIEEILNERKLTRQRVLNSKQYLQLKQKYKRFLEQYKDIRAQNWNLKCIVDQKEAQLQFSDSDAEHC